MSEEKPRVGVGVMIWKDRKILLTRRKGSHGAGEYSFPGGHLEYGESFEACARRETKEECGVEIKKVRFQYLANVTNPYRPRHYVHIGMVAEWESGDPTTLEPDKAEEWKWYALNDLPEPLFHMCRLAVESYWTGNTYYPDADVGNGDHP